MKRFAAGVLLLLASGVLVAVSSAPAYAVDGVVLINQNTATSGLPGCPGPNPGDFPIIVCNSGSYRLSGNLVVSSNFEDAIDITADGVTLDLNGFTIKGPFNCVGTPNQTCFGAAMSGINSGANNIAVRNGVVRGFESGVYLFGGVNFTVEEITATRNVNGIVVGNLNGIVSGGGGLVRRNIASLNFYGIQATGSTVMENVANSNGIHGLQITGGVYGSNTFSGNGASPVINSNAISQQNNYCGTTTPC